VVPLGIEVFAGVTAIDCSAGPVTVTDVDPLIDAEVAVMVADPAVTAVSRPVLEIDATPVAVDAQVTLPVMFCVELSVYVPVAVYCWVLPLGMEALAGVTAIETRFGLVTVREAVPLTEADVAVMVTGPPAATPVANPAALIVAVAVAEEVQVALPVKFCVELSL
jgi:hypothetical protein